MNAKTSYSQPPIVEVVLGAQFMPLELTPGHLGAYWAEKLGRAAWPEVREVGYLQDQFEKFGEEGKWAQQLQAALMPAGAPNRVQFINKRQDRMIQLQRSRFILNWIKKNGEYPRYETLLEEFKNEYVRLEQFLAEDGAGQTALNQWEVTYVNHCARGEEWESLADWERIFKFVRIPYLSSIGCDLQAPGANWTFLLGTDRGKLRCTIQLARHNETGNEVIRFQLVARGPCRPSTLEGLQSGFDTGHAAIVSCFTELTTAEAHKAWGREDG